MMFQGRVNKVCKMVAQSMFHFYNKLALLVLLGGLAQTENTKCQALHKNHAKILAANLKLEQEP